MSGTKAISSEEQHCLKSLSVENRVAITLWRLGTNIEYRSLSHLFGVSLSTVCVTVSDVCSAFVEHLASRYIAIPDRERLKLVVDGFMSKWGGGGSPACWSY